MLKLVCEEYDGDVRSKMEALLRCGWRCGAVVEWWLTKIKRGRRKTLPKDHSHLNHMNSHYTRGRG